MPIHAGTMKRPRPYIPIKVRLIVATRQAAQKFGDNYAINLTRGLPDGKALKVLLHAIFDGAQVALDHDPPLRTRMFHTRLQEYSPAANSPAHLIYRTAVDHQIKTNVRGDHGQYPDRVLIKRERRREKPIKRKSKKLRGRSQWPKGRKIPSRPFDRRKRWRDGSFLMPRSNGFRRPTRQSE